MKQYPHFLFMVSATETGRDSKGNYVEPTKSTIFLSECREETNGRGRQIVRGGQFVIFSSLIQLPISCAPIKEGTKVFISNDSTGTDIRIEGTVLKFDKGQLHNRLWI
ncbi:MAG: hypothetical protein PHU69_08100 [Fermentimonas sp.]|nr:hypothetical protein [Fermentimonas sp.]